MIRCTGALCILFLIKSKQVVGNSGAADTIEIPFGTRNVFGANGFDGTDKTFVRLLQLSNKRPTVNKLIRKSICFRANESKIPMAATLLN